MLATAAPLFGTVLPALGARPAMPHCQWCVTATRPPFHPKVDHTQGEAGATTGASDHSVIRLLPRANKKLMALAAADPSLAAAAADSSSGAKEDLRHVVDGYGKTAGRLAWDMQRWVQLVVVHICPPDK